MRSGRLSELQSLVPNEFYDASFEDARGVEKAQIHNAGHELRLSLRGVDFCGDDFDGFVPIPEHLDRAKPLFTLSYFDELCSCRLEWIMPLPVEVKGQALTWPLKATLTLGNPAPNRGIDSETLALELTIPRGVLRSRGDSGWFEDELLDLERQLRPEARIRSCITCAFSDYNPAGHGLFGSLACFREVKDEYVHTRTKREVFAVWDRLTEYVQETYSCEEWQARIPDTGYRG